jgi:hypothetical protein
MVSQRFPADHPRKGEPTDFLMKITEEPPTKIHTIRKNWELWKRRIQAVNEGKAVLSIRYWSGKPYRTPQVELMQLKGDEVGFQKVQLDLLGFFIDDYDTDIKTRELAINDGLSTEDFLHWFKGEWKEAMGIIHFTKFRYKNSSKPF